LICEAIQPGLSFSFSNTTSDPSCVRDFLGV
jgi:hypothetical protein